MKYFMDKKILALPILLSITACGGGSSSSSTPTNSPPMAQAEADQSVDEQTMVTLSGVGTDNDGSVSSYLWQQTSGQSVQLTATDEATSSFTTPVSTQQHTLSFSLKVTDNEGSTATDSIDIVVNPVNQSPTVNAGDNINVDARQSVSLTASASDVDGSIETYLWEQLEGPSVNINTSDTPMASFNAPDVDSEANLVIRLTVSDNEGASTSDTMTVVVSPKALFNDSQVIADTSAYKLQHNGAASILAFKQEDDSFHVTDYSHQANGGFAALEFATAIQSRPGIVIDMDNDQDLDIVQNALLDDNGINYFNLQWLENTGSQTFTQAHILHDSFGLMDPTRGGPVPEPFVTDLNSDGNMDGVSIVNNVSAHRSEMFFHVNNQGSFDSHALTIGGWINRPSRLAFADFNGDGEKDMVYDNYSTGVGASSLRIAVNNGDNTISFSDVADHQTFAQPRFVSQGVDLNGDDNQDLLSTVDELNNFASPQKSKIVLFVNPGNGEFSEHQMIFDSSHVILETRVVDLNNDGTGDILFANDNGEVKWLSNQGNTAFAEAKHIASFDNSLALDSFIVSDLDGDGDQDVALLLVEGLHSGNMNKIIWFENTTL